MLASELDHALWDQLLAATSKPKARLCKVTLLAIADAEMLRTFTEEVEHSAPPPQPRTSRSHQRSTWPDNATGRRLSARLYKVCPMLAKQLGRVYVRRPLWKWL